jgi:hypothetical protein
MMRVDKPGIYEMSLAEYVADPAPQPSLNTGTALTLLTQSPLHAKMQHVRLNPNAEREESSRADLGTIAHALLLEDDGSRVVEIDADDWRTKAAKKKRDEARAAGKVPVLKKDYGTVQFIVGKANHFLMGSELCGAWFGAKSEQTLVWEEDGVWFRARPDKLTPDYRIDFDYKTSGSAHPAAFVKTVISQGYDLQVALRRRGIKALTGVDAQPIFVVQEIDAPYAVSLVSLSPMFLTIADERLNLAIDRWMKCVAEDDWPGYPDKVATVDPPAWYGMDQLEAL